MQVRKLRANKGAVASRRQTQVPSSLAAAAGQTPEVVTIKGKRPMILHNDRPEDLETPLNYFDRWITPNDAFFVRQHLPRPVIDEAAFRLALSRPYRAPASTLP